jgi:serine/threonine-protein kinase HipA
VLPVFYEDHLVGEIEESKVGFSFTYSPDWLRQENRFAISLTMPLRSDPFPPETATPWFANLLPEDRQLEQISQILRHSQGDVYGLLEQIGGETAGALSIGGAEPIGKAEYRELSDEELSDIIRRLPQRPMLAGEPDVTMSLAGAQTKLAVAIFEKQIALPLHGAASTHILKPASERLFATVENELLCMRLAAKLGLPVAQTSMRALGDIRYLLVERYDRNVAGPRAVRRDHQEDFCQALGYLPTQKYEARHGPGFKNLFMTLDQHVRRSARDRLNLLDLIIFSCAIGDTDRHGKNFSLILTNGGPRLAPGYDLLSSLPYDGITRNLAMKIAGKNRAEHIERRHWERFAQEVGLSPAATVRRVAQLATSTSEQVAALADELADELPVSRDSLRLFASTIQKQSAQVAASSQRDSSADQKSGEAD